MAKVTKILETTLSAGATTAIFSDADIPNSLIRVFATNSNIYPQSISLSGTTLTVTYEEQTASMGVAIELTKQGLDIINNLTSSDDAAALSAKQGKVLKDAIDAIPTPPEDITDLGDVLITDIEDGQVLAWDDSEQKFVNVDQSGGGSGISYSETEQDTGLKWTDGKTIYQKTFELASGTVTGGVINVANTTGIDNIINCECTCIQTNNSRHYTLPLIRTTASECIYKNVYVDNGTLYMQIVSGTAYVLNTIKFTVWYTKS